MKMIAHRVWHHYIDRIWYKVSIYQTGQMAARKIYSADRVGQLGSRRNDSQAVCWRNTNAVKSVLQWLVQRSKQRPRSHAAGRALSCCKALQTRLPNLASPFSTVFTVKYLV
jgi:hypothetical protein